MYLQKTYNRSKIFPAVFRGKFHPTIFPFPRGKMPATPTRRPTRTGNLAQQLSSIGDKKKQTKAIYIHTHFFSWANTTLLRHEHIFNIFLLIQNIDFPGEPGRDGRNGFSEWMLNIASNITIL